MKNMAKVRSRSMGAHFLVMGHAKELITMDVHGDNPNIIPEEIPELGSYMNDILPKKKEE